jgi:hypothetical protein
MQTVLWNSWCDINEECVKLLLRSAVVRVVLMLLVVLIVLVVLGLIVILVVLDVNADFWNILNMFCLYSVSMIIYQENVKWYFILSFKHSSWSLSFQVLYCTVQMNIQIEKQTLLSSIIFTIAHYRSVPFIFYYSPLFYLFTFSVFFINFSDHHRILWTT